MRTLLVVATSLVTIGASGYFIYQYYDRLTPEGPRPNILVISTCSLRKDAVGDMPRVNQFFDQGAYSFDNAFNGLGWTALFAVTAPEIRNRWFRKVGYEPAGMWVKRHMFLIPFRNSWRKGFTRKQKREGLAPPDSNFEKDYRESLDFFVNSISGPRSSPFFVVAQIKYAHFPLIDRYNTDSGWDQFLTTDEKSRIESYLKAPGHYSAKLPLLLMLTNDSKFLHSHPRIDKAMANDAREGGHDNAFLGLLNSPRFLSEWKASPDYEIDLAILKKIYKANVLYMDKIIGEMLDRLKASGVLDNTVVIFAGDHGEVHMERGHLTHGTSWYDEALRVPLKIRFPAQRESASVESQTNFFSVTQAITGIAEGRLNANNFLRRWPELADPMLIARDCSNTWRAVRYDNRWKYAVDNSTNESWLFDLQNDPGETRNLINDQPEVVAEMESLYWDRLPRLSNQMVNSCAPWPGPGGVRPESSED